MSTQAIFRWTGNGDFLTVVQEADQGITISLGHANSSMTALDMANAMECIELPMAEVARLAQALVKLPMVQELKGHPVVLWLPTKADAQELVDVIREAMPNMRSVEIG